MGYNRGIMINARPLPPAPALARLLLDHQDAIVGAWLGLVLDQPDTRYAALAPDEVREVVRRALLALVRAIELGSLRALDDFLAEVEARRLGMGFGADEIVEALLRTREAAIPSLRAGAADLSGEQAGALFEVYLHRAVGRYATTYAEHVAREVREQQQRTALVLEATQTAASTLQLDEVLARIATTIAAAVGVPDCGIYLLEEGETALAPRFPLSAPDPQRLTAFLRHPLDPAAPLLDEAIERRRPVACPDVRRIPAPNTLLARDLGVVAVLVLPLTAGEHVLGLAIAGSSEPREFAPALIELAHGIATSGALAVANARLFEETRRQLAESRRLHRQIEELAVVAERQRLSRDLHDSVAQSLYSLSLYTEAASGALADGEAQTAAAHLAEVAAIARETIGEMRLLIHNLRPPALDAEGLVGALQGRLDAVESRAKLRAELDVQGEDRLAPELRQELYAIAQEALNNVIKHAHAAHVWVRLCFGATTTLSIEDDGIGFEQGAPGRGGFGLRGMSERAQRLGATLSLTSAPGLGTRIAVEVPV